MKKIIDSQNGRCLFFLLHQNSFFPGVVDLTVFEAWFSFADRGFGLGVAGVIFARFPDFLLIAS
jgi:hypothetical protein